MKRAVMIFCIAVLTCGLFFLVKALTSEPWPKIKYSEVRAYAWPGTADSEEYVILKDMTLRDGVLNKDGAKLDTTQIKTLLTAVTVNHEEHPIMKCYNPHNAFVFYEGKRPVAFVEICFDCLQSRAQPEGSSRWTDLVALAKIFDELKLPIGRFKNSEEFAKTLSR